MIGRHDAGGPPDASASDGTSGRVRRPARRHRRVTTDAVPGSDPTPTPEPERHALDENDERLKTDKPPHWS